MKFGQAVKIMSLRSHLNITDEQHTLYNEAAGIIQLTAGLPDEAYDWILEGDYDGDETAAQIAADWNED